MAISKHRKTHHIKVAQRYQELVAMRLEAGMTANGNFPQDKTAPKREPLRNPNRVNMNKGQKRVAKALRHAQLAANEI